ncbi:unnamed protein product [Acanthoscelides obtectus]|uniref:Uncharacterized protein n=1 Tax=Acanthoscelides obtectus TaxID=200917 RepID=A0A9P0MF55_ACAOB|nr:unnamed protein product [Acanthoscelides obtectus]CAK1646632.1 hypothetical protein AOBTE_LOCUS14770 [Acanthoscelides obtectus]
MLHPRADTDRLYVSRKEGGRGLQQVEAAYKSAILSISDYCENSPDRMIMIARNYDLSLPVTKSLIQTATKFSRQLSIRESLGPDLQKRKNETNVTGSDSCSGDCDLNLAKSVNEAHNHTLESVNHQTQETNNHSIISEQVVLSEKPVESKQPIVPE